MVANTLIAGYRCLCQGMLLPASVQTTGTSVRLCGRCYSLPTLTGNTADDADLFMLFAGHS